MKPFIFHGFIGFVFIVFFQQAVFAKTVKLAVIIGNNNGLGENENENEKRLRFAVSDGRSLYQTLTTMGGFKSANCHILANAKKMEILNKLSEISHYVDSLKARGIQTLLLIYYSGHGSKMAWHVEGEKIPVAQITRYFKSNPADLKILISDACYSGVLIKGPKTQGPIKDNIKMYDTLSVTGSVILTSSTGNEQSKESFDLNASYFTYYLNSGLRGAADKTNDSLISLMEVYEYIKDNIINIQTPAFEINLSGSENLVLTNIGNVKKRSIILVFKNVPHGKYRIFDENKIKTIADVTVDRDSVVLALPASNYMIFSREDNDLTARKDLSRPGRYVISEKDFTSENGVGKGLGDGETVKVALIVGNSSGISAEPYHKYPANNARSIYQILIKGGEFDSLNCHLLTNPTKTILLDKIKDLSNQVKSLKKQGKNTQFLFYYSGPGSSHSFHISGETLSLPHFKTYIKRMDADLQFIILDMNWTRSAYIDDSKDRLDVTMEETVGWDVKEEPIVSASRSVIAISLTTGTASSPVDCFGPTCKSQKVTQNSDPSYFSNYFRSGLMGVADINNDSSVTLKEALNYARNSIKNYEKNNSWSLNVYGNDNLILAKKENFGCNLVFEDMPHGKYRVFKKRGKKNIVDFVVSKKFIADVVVEDTNVSISLPPGIYIVKRLDTNKIILTEKVLTRWGRYEVRPGDFFKVPTTLHWQIQISPVKSILYNLFNANYNYELMYFITWNRVSISPLFGLLWNEDVEYHPTIENLGVLVGGEIRLFLLNMLGVEIFPWLDGTAYIGFRTQYQWLRQSVEETISHGTKVPDGGGPGGVTYKTLVEDWKIKEKSKTGIYRMSAIVCGKIHRPLKPWFFFSLTGGVGPQWYYGKNNRIESKYNFFLSPSIGLQF